MLKWYILCPGVCYVLFTYETSSMGVGHDEKNRKTGLGLRSNF